MDPISFAASIGSLTEGCLLTVKKVGELATKFKDAAKILHDVSSEARVITIALTQLQSTIVLDEYSVLGQALLTAHIRDVLDTALRGCRMTLSCIDVKTRSLASKVENNLKLNHADRARIFWKDDKFTELLKQLRKEHSAIGILQQRLQM
jgi:hypothetical protein